MQYISIVYHGYTVNFSRNKLYKNSEWNWTYMMRPGQLRIPDGQYNNIVKVVKMLNSGNFDGFDPKELVTTMLGDK